ncbi:MAG: isoprenylcysteine carboxylmethyltransferase family protein [Melioribacteraceae bacterium]|nr:isoprenylcysteine carboxylmethyltransferase family protein [Melioribacteraceae bacterium]
MIYIEVILVFLLFASFGILHSFLASLNIKEKLVVKIGNKIAFYRLFYNIFSVLLLIFIYEISPKPNLVIYDLQFPYDIITFALQVLSLFGLIWSTKEIDLKEFAGISQIIRYYNNTYNIEELDEKQSLRIEGAFKFVRHPIYFFSILFLGLRPQMDLFYLTMFISFVIYFYVGSFYEEKKLIKIFGEDYLKYQKSVPRIFPIKFKRKKNEN